jgi:hypothetical protein
MEVRINQSPVNTNIAMESDLERARREKLKKVAAVAVAYYLKQEQKCEANPGNCNPKKRWVSTRQAIHMRGRLMVQQRGRVASTRTLFKKPEIALAS